LISLKRKQGKLWDEAANFPKRKRGLVEEKATVFGYPMILMVASKKGLERQN